MTGFKQLIEWSMNKKVNEWMDFFLTRLIDLMKKIQIKLLMKWENQRQSATIKSKKN